jgi:tetratricopeptide (TPR) repeat protein
MFRRAGVLSLCLLLAAVAISLGLRWSRPAITADEAVTEELPVPPFPPRITEGSAYEDCLASLADDPEGAMAEIQTWQAHDGDGDGAAHCQGLALIALGQPDAGATVLEQLARRSSAPPMARASVLGQAVQARLMGGQADAALADATMALELSPADTELLIMRATVQEARGRNEQAIEDLDTALRQDGGRTDALVSRAALRRKLGQLADAGMDIAEALSLSPDDADALLERGILRQRAGDRAGARADWERARGADPGSSTADLAEQNLSLLEAGPEQK